MISAELKNVFYTYSKGTPFESAAVSDVSAVFESNMVTGIIGHTGSGKSTVAQLINGLLPVSSGEVFVCGKNIWAEPKKMREVRFTAGLVFQYPEYQLFDETVYKDISFGPKNMGLSEKETDERVREAALAVGLDEALLEKSPFELSGGQKRRAAIAGVLAMRPQVLILDEPAAGLDPKGRREILGKIAGYKERTGAAVIMVSHSMEDIAEYCDRIVVMSDSRVLLCGTPREVFSHADELIGTGLAVPQVTKVLYGLKNMGYDVDTSAYTVKDAEAEILRLFGGEKKMLKDVTLGQFFPGNSIFHKTDPRIKILLTIAYVVAIFLAKSAAAYAFLLLISVLMTAMSGIKLSVILKGIKPLIFVVIITAVINVFWYSPPDEAEPLFGFWKINVYLGGLLTALYMAVRILCLILGTGVVLTYTTSPIALTDAIESLLSPLRLIKLPVHEFSMMMTIALRFIPTLIEETDKIMSAQKARGADFSSGGLIKRAKALLPVLVPLFISAFRRADELAVAMECRCYRGGDGRTKMTKRRLCPFDFILVVFFGIFIAGVVLINKYLPYFTV